MVQVRSLLACVLALVLPFYVVLPAVAANPSIDVLTLATHAHVEGSLAFSAYRYSRASAYRRKFRR
jgi:hypothetical protein